MHGSTLSHLDLSYTHVDDMRLLCLPCPNIVTLNLSSCMDLDPKSLMRALGISINIDPQQPRGIDHMQVVEEGDGGEEEVEALLPHLKHLDVSYCKEVLQVQYVPLLILQGGRKLVSLSINGCRDLKDATWQSIFNPNKGLENPLDPLSLETLSLKQCIGIKSVTLTPSCGLFKNLKSLRLALSSVERIEIEHQALLDLDLNVCAKLSSMQLACPLIQKISMQSCRLIKPKGESKV